MVRNLMSSRRLSSACAAGVTAALVASGALFVATPQPAAAAKALPTGELVTDADFKASTRAQIQARKKMSVDATTVPLTPPKTSTVAQYAPGLAPTVSLPTTVPDRATGAPDVKTVAGNDQSTTVAGVGVSLDSREKGKPGAKVALARDPQRGVVLAVEKASTSSTATGVAADLTVATGDLWASPTAAGRIVARDVTACVDDATCAGDVLPTSIDSKSGNLSITLDRSVTHVALSTAATSATSGESPSGNFAATPMTPSSSWSAGGQSGAFTWNYPIGVAPAAGGLGPDLGLSYNSASIDGRTFATNNQASWVGDGFDLNVGAITRDYRSCIDDMSGGNNSTKTGDLCWANDNAQISFGGHSGRLVNLKDANGDPTSKWRLKNDDGTVLERLSGGNDGHGGQYWKLTDTAGTEYYFGLENGKGAGTNSAFTVPVAGNQSGEPCRASAFKDSFCDQVWKWNLSYVVDRNGNSMRYHWVKESNRYGQNNDESTAGYVRGGYLSRIDYGLRDATSTDEPRQRVVFSVAERCLPTGEMTCSPGELQQSTAQYWPDVPQDLICSSSTSCGETNTSPAFFTRKRLSKITTQYRTGAAAYTDVDTFELTHTFPSSGDVGPPALWLSSIVRTGREGTDLALPAVTFSPTQAMPNRVDAIGDGAPSYNRRRMGWITTESGGTITVQYKDPGNDKPASATTNTTLNYPVKLVPLSGGDPQTFWFHTYPVHTVTSDGNVGMGAPVTTTYAYTQPAWHKDDQLHQPDDLRTYSDFRGFEKVESVTGPPGSSASLRTVDVYYQGMPGTTVTGVLTAAENGGTTDQVSDAEAFSGQLYESVTYNGDAADAAKVSATRSEYGKVTDHDAVGGTPAAQAAVIRSHALRFLDDGSTQRTRTDTTYDAYGLPTQVNNVGDVTISGDETCMSTTYARNMVENIIGKPATIKSWGTSCGTASTTETLIDETQTYYDGSITLGGAPTKGLPTMIKRRNDTGWFTQAASTYDAYGRPLSATDALGRTTTTAYTPATHDPTTATSVTNDKGHVTTTTLAPGLGAPTRIEDANGKYTHAQLDALGRVSKVWNPGDSASGANISGDPSVTYTYRIANTSPSYVTTSARNRDGDFGHKVETTLMDGFLTPVQTQATAETLQADGIMTPGRVITSHYTDHRGLEISTLGPWYQDGTNPGTTIVTPSGGAADVEKETRTTYDGAGRPTAVSLYGKGTLKYATKTVYHGDSTDTLPPAGQLATRETTDALGRRTALRTYPDNTTASTGTLATFGYDAKHRLGNITRQFGSSPMTWTYEYDQLGNVTQTSDPDKGTGTSTYDNAGQQLTSTDARGTTLTYTYDTLGRKTSEKNGTTTLAAWTYDTLAKGQLTSSTSYVAGQAYTSKVNGYNDRYQPTSESTVIPAAETGLAGTYTTTHEYWANGLLRWSDLPVAGNLTKTRSLENVDQMDRPAQTQYVTLNADGTSGPQGVAANLGLDPFGRTASIYAGGGGGGYPSMVTREIDPTTDRLTREQVSHTITALTDTGTVTYPYVANKVYSYTAGGQITRITDQPGGTARSDNQCFQYGTYARLEKAWTQTSPTCAADPSWSEGTAAPYWSEWTYDSAWRRKSEKRHTNATDYETSTYTYPTVTSARPHGVTSVKTTKTVAGATSTLRTQKLTYDATGNTLTTPLPNGKAEGTQADGAEITWDARGDVQDITPKPTSAPSASTRHIADADGNVLIRRDTTGSTLFLGHTDITYTKSTSTLSGQRYFSGNREVLHVRRAGTSADAIRFLPGDHQGTALNLVREDAASANERRYTPFGGVRQAVAWIGDRGWLGGTGATTGRDNGLVHLGARQYDPTLGRFLSVDPLLVVDDLRQYNGYAYAGQDPITNSDPSGEKLAIDNSGQRTASPKTGYHTSNGGGGGGGGGGSSYNYNGSSHHESYSTPARSTTPQQSTWAPQAAPAPATPRYFNGPAGTIALSGPAKEYQRAQLSRTTGIGTGPSTGDMIRAAGIVGGVAVCIGTGIIVCAVGGAAIGVGAEVAAAKVDNEHINTTSMVIAAAPIPGAGVGKGIAKTVGRGAAKSGDDLTRVGRWMSEDELVKMQKTGFVQEGAGGRTFVTNPADPAAFPAGKGIFAEFNVPTKSLFPAGKPEWSVIPGPNVGTARFGPPPSQMPSATCISVVCRR